MDASLCQEAVCPIQQFSIWQPCAPIAPAGLPDPAARDWLWQSRPSRRAIAAWCWPELRIAVARSSDFYARFEAMKEGAPPCRGDREAARPTWEKTATRFPGTDQASAARLSLASSGARRFRVGWALVGAWRQSAERACGTAPRADLRAAGTHSSKVVPSGMVAP